MRILRACIVVLALGPALFMTFDGSRALILGDYLTPTSGRFAGQLGPWSDVIKVVFVLLGVAWLGAIAAFLRHARRSAGILAVLAVMTLWYLPLGTTMSALVLVGLARLGWRSNRPLQPTSDPG